MKNWLHYFSTKIVGTILVAGFHTVSTSAQAPEKMNYQAIVRNANNEVMPNSPITIRISLLKGSVDGAPVFAESQTTTTNANGLFTIQIGSGNLISGSLSAIDWSDGPYFIKTETDPAGGTNYSLSGVSPLLTVPYAFYAKSAGNGFSGSYDDLSNKPQLFDGTWASLSNKPALSQIATSGNYSDLLNKPLLFSGNYNDLSGKPVLFSGNYSDLLNKPALFSGNYNDLTNKPVLFNGSWTSLTGKPTTVAGYGITDAFSGSFSGLTGKPTTIAGYGIMDAVTTTGNQTIAGNKTFTGTTTVPTPVNASDASTKAYVDLLKSQINYSDLLNKPVLFSGNYNDLTNKPVLFNGSWTSLTGKPSTIAGYGITDAFNGTFSSLTGKPTTLAGYGITDAFSGSFSGLTGKPTTIAGYGITDAVTTTGNQTIAGNKTFSGTTTVLTPVNASDASTKAYVDLLKTQINDLSEIITMNGLKIDVVTIGTQTWMVDNLKVTHYRNGDKIPNVEDNFLWQNQTAGAFCWYYNYDGYKENWGALYNWYAVNDPRNICPTGFHVATDNDWKILERAMGMAVSSLDQEGWRGTDEGGKLKETGNTYWDSNTDATNSSGFSARGAGYRDVDGNFYEMLYRGGWWTATPKALTTDQAWNREIYNYNAQITRYAELKTQGRSVRCIKD